MIAATSTIDEAISAGARPPLPAGVEPRLPEDEPGDRDQERQPLCGACLPEQVPEDRVAEDEAAENERGVETECEPERIEPCEHRHRPHAPGEAAESGAPEDVRPAGAVVRGARRAAHGFVPDADGRWSYGLGGHQHDSRRWGGTSTVGTPRNRP